MIELPPYIALFVLQTLDCQPILVYTWIQQQNQKMVRPNMAKEEEKKRTLPNIGPINGIPSYTFYASS